MSWASQVSLILTLGDALPDDRVLRAVARVQKRQGEAELWVVGASEFLRGQRHRGWLWASSDKLTQREVGARRSTRRYCWFLDLDTVEAWTDEPAAERAFWSPAEARIERAPLEETRDWGPRNRFVGGGPAGNCGGSGAIAVFVETPGYSPPPSGLSPAQHDCVLESLFNLLQGLESRSAFQPIWAVREALGYLDPRWRSYPRVPQGTGSAAERTYGVYHELLDRFGRVILVDSGLPQIRPRDLWEAEKGLDRFEFVLGPTREGGVYLLAGRRELVWEEWSRRAEEPWRFDTLRQALVERFGAGKVGILSPLHARPAGWVEDFERSSRDDSYADAQLRSLERWRECCV